MSGNYAYVISVTAKLLQVVNVSNPSSPSVVGSVAIGNGPQYVDVQGRYAYVTNNSDSTMQVIDISNPANPVTVSTPSTGTGPRAITVNGRYAYVTNDGSSTLQILDISNPSSVTSTGTVASGSMPIAVKVQGRYAYVLNRSSNTLQVIDVSNPASPTTTATLGSLGSVQKLDVAGRYVYIVDDTNSTLRIVDVSDPTAPVSQGTVSTGSGPIAVSVSGRYAYVANQGSNSLQVFDVGGSYIQNLQAGSIESSGITTKDLAVANNVSVGGGINVSRGATISGNFAVNGDSVFGSATNSTTAFQIQNAAGTSLLTADTTNSRLTVVGDVNIGSRAGNRLFSDGFESGNFDLWTQGTAGPITIDTTTVRSGKYSAKFNPASNSAYALTLLPSSSPTVYWRGYINNTALSTYVDLVQIANSSGTTLVYLFWDSPSNQICIWNNVTSSTVGCTASGVSQSVWHKIELRATVDTATTGVLTLWVDDVQEVTSTTENLGTVNIDRFYQGVTDTTQTATYYMDDVVVSTTSNGKSASLNVDDSLHVGGSATVGQLVVNGAAELTGRLTVNGGMTIPLTNTVYQSEAATTKADVYAYINTSDKVRFAAPYAAEYYNGSSWVTWSTPPDFRALTDGYDGTGLTIDVAHKNFRLIYSGLNCSYMNGALFTQGYQTHAFTYTIESSPDATTYTSIGSGSSDSGDQVVAGIQTYTTCSDEYYRVTFNASISGVETFQPTTIELRTDRPGNQGGTGFATYLPFSYGLDKSILLQNSADSANAFVVKDLAGTSIFQVETTAGNWSQVRIGGTRANADLVFAGGSVDQWEIGSDQLGLGGANGFYLYNTPATAYVMGVNATTGAFTFQNSTDSTAAFQIQDQTGDIMLRVDTSSATDSQIYVGGAKANAEVAFVGGGVQRWNIGTSSAGLGGANSFYLYDEVNPGFVFGVATGGGAIFRNSVNSSTAFQIQNLASQTLFSVDTNGGALFIGDNTVNTAVTIDSGTDAINIGTGAQARTVNVGTGAAAQTVTIGSTNTTSALTLQSGTGALNLQTQGTGGINIGTNAVAQVVTLGNSTGATQVVLNAGTAGINIGSNGIANTLQIGNTTGAVAQTINIGTNATASSTSNITIGSTVAGTTTLRGLLSATGAVLQGTNTTGLTFEGATADAFETTLSVVDPTVGDQIYQLPNAAAAGTYQICTTANNCTGLTGYLVQAPTSTAQNTIQPATTAVVGLTVNGTNTGTAATALAVAQTGAAAALTVSNSSATATTVASITAANTATTQTNTLLLDRNGASGTTTNALNITQTAGTLTNGIIFNGTISTDITTAAARVLNVTTGTTGALTLDTGTTGAINIGTNANAKTTTIGNVTGLSVVTINAGTGNAGGDINIGDTTVASKIIDIGSVTNAGTSTVRIATGAAVQTLTAGSTNTTSVTTIQGGNSATALRLMTASGGTLSVGDNGVASTIQIGNTTGAFTQTINIGNNATASSTTNIILGSTIAGTTTLNSALLANNSATGTTGTTTGVGATNTTAVTLTAAGAFANGDIILVDNTGGSGQDYYTRITSGAGTVNLVVDVAVSWGTAAGYTGNATITKYNVQNIGAVNSGTSFSHANRFFQGYFLGGVVTGAGSTTLSDQSLMSTGALYVKTNGNNTRLTISSAGDATFSGIVTAPRFVNDLTNSLGTTAGNTTSDVANFGYTSTNQTQLFVRGYRDAGGATWATEAIQLGRRTDVTVQGYISFYGNSGVGINKTNPAAGLDVNGAINGSSTLTVAGASTINITGMGGLTVNGASSTWANFIANLGSGSYNGRAQAGDRGIIWGGASSGSPGGGFVIAPWGGTYGLRLNSAGQLENPEVNGNINVNTGKIILNRANATGHTAAAALDLQIDGITQGMISVPSSGILQASTTFKAPQLYATAMTNANSVYSVCINAGTGELVYVFNITCPASSDQRLKTNISTIGNALDKLAHIKGVTFNWADTNGPYPTDQQVGVIAQDVLQAFPQLVSTTQMPLNGVTSTYYTVNYQGLVGPLIQGVNELNVKVNAIDVRLAGVEAGNFNGNLSVAGYANITGNLTVTGDTILTKLTVTGDTEVQKLTVNGKIITLGTAPTVAVGTSAGNILTATAAVTGNDTAGTVSITTGATGTIANDILGAITFATPYDQAPIVTVSPTTEDSASIRYFLIKTTTGWSIKVLDTPATNKTYSFDYHVIQ